MTRRTKLTDDEIGQALQSLSGWTYEGGKLGRDFVFADFKEAVSFIVRVGFEAEAVDHHPELTNVYNRVGVSLRTHDADNSVTAMDVDLARKISALV